MNYLYINELIKTKSQPLRIPDQYYKQATNDDTVYLGFLSPDFVDYQRLLPAGYIYEFKNENVTSDIVRLRETEIRGKFPNLYLEPGNTSPHRWEKEAYSTTFWQRGIYFQTWEMYDLAIDEYKRSIKWADYNGDVWFQLGQCLEKTGAGSTAIRAAYEGALQATYWHTGASKSLALLEWREGNLKKALEWAEYSVKYNSKDEGAQRLKNDLEKANSLN